MPLALRHGDALGMFGLDSVGLSDAEYAAGEMLGAMKFMTFIMQYLSGPYSPFFSDEAHPNFLERVALAVSTLPVSEISPVSGQAPILQEEIRRLRTMAGSWYREIHSPGPITRVAAADGSVFIGTRTLSRTAESQEHSALYQMLENAKSEFQFELIDELLIGKATGGLDAWLDKKLKTTAPNAETMGFAANAGVVAETLLFAPDRTDREGGLEFADWGWVFDINERRGFVTLTEVQDKVSKLLPNDYGITAQIGSPIKIGEALVFPVSDANGERLSTLKLRVVPGAEHKPSFLYVKEPFATREVVRFFFSLSIANGVYRMAVEIQDGFSDVEGIRWNGNRWLIPGRDFEPDVWKLWVTDGTGTTPQLLASEKMLSEFLQDHGVSGFGRDLSPFEASLLILSKKSALLWYDTDSVWLVNQDGAFPIYHPATNDLRVTLLDNDQVLFWIPGATKAYIINIQKIGDNVQ